MKSEIEAKLWNTHHALERAEGYIENAMRIMRQAADAVDVAAQAVKDIHEIMEEDQ